MKKEEKRKTLPKGITIKWVKQAGMWCRTSAKSGKQIIEWFKEKPEKPTEKPNG